MEIANVIESFSIIIAAWTVIISLTAWRREYIGKRNLELAEDILSLFYETRDVIGSIRSPLGFVGEGSTRKASPNESHEDKEVYDRGLFNALKRSPNLNRAAAYCRVSTDDQERESTLLQPNKAILEWHIHHRINVR